MWEIEKEPPPPDLEQTAILESCRLAHNHRNTMLTPEEANQQLLQRVMAASHEWLPRRRLGSSSWRPSDKGTLSWTRVPSPRKTVMKLSDSPWMPSSPWDDSWRRSSGEPLLRPHHRPPSTSSGASVWRGQRTTAKLGRHARRPTASRVVFRLNSVVFSFNSVRYNKISMKILIYAALFNLYLNSVDLLSAANRPK
jgi:hypothetical protein